MPHSIPAEPPAVDFSKKRAMPSQDHTPFFFEISTHYAIPGVRSRGPLLFSQTYPMLLEGDISPSSIISRLGAIAPPAGLAISADQFHKTTVPCFDKPVIDYRSHREAFLSEGLARLAADGGDILDKLKALADQAAAAIALGLSAHQGPAIDGRLPGHRSLDPSIGANALADAMRQLLSLAQSHEIGDACSPGSPGAKAPTL